MPDPEPSSARPPEERWEVWFPLAGSLLLLASWYWRGGHQPLWLDEFFTLTLVRDPSPAHLLRALAAGTDGGMPLFYLLGWVWYRLVPAGELAWRLLPALLLVGAWWTWWRILRPRFGFLPAALALATQWLAVEAIGTHLIEFRFYALVILAQAGTIALLLHWKANPTSPGRVAALAGANLMLVFSHPFGLFYSAALAGGALAASLHHHTGRDRRRLLTVWVGGWVLFGLSWGPGLLGQMSINEPHGWLSPPTWFNLLEVLSPWGNPRVATFALWPWILALAWTGAAPAVGTSGPGLTAPDAGTDRRWLLAAAFACAALGPLLWLVSRFLEPLFLPRYLLPAGLAWAIPTAWLLGKLPRPAGGLAQLPLAQSALAACALTGAALLGPYFRRSSLLEIDSITGRIDAGRWPEHLPVVCESPHVYLPRHHYQGHLREYWLLLDEAASRSPEAGRNAACDHNLMTRLREYYGAGHRLCDIESFLATRHDFILLNETSYLTAELNLPAGEWRQETLGTLPHPHLHGARYLTIHRMRRSGTGPNGVPDR